MVVMSSDHLIVILTFILFHRCFEIMDRINQPEKCSVFNQTVLIFKSPKQDYDVIREIKDAGLQLRLAAFR